ncbi:MAG: hypothetical protein U0132_21420 [Gemmatimonadaceae bacterium]
MSFERPRRFSCLLLAGILLPSALWSQQSNPVLDVVRAFESVGKLDLWPGYRPDTVPLAIYDGQRTWLVHHPSPPNGFSPSAAGSDILVMEGRHPEVTANSSAQIGGRLTATLIPNFGTRPAMAWAAVAAHEAFHAYQRATHPTWAANEANLFTYPWNNVEALSLRRLEFDALRRALTAADPRAQGCFASLAMTQRKERFRLMGPDAATYETRNELNEGLAQYIQDKAAGASALERMPTEEFPPDGVRDRVYRSGSAMGQILDRLDPTWRRQLEQGDSSLTLQKVLEEAATRAEAGAPSTCAQDRSFAVKERMRAKTDIASLTTRLAAERRKVITRPGWSVVIDASQGPLGLAGFDPLNVSRLTTTDILHRRYVKLGNAGGEMEAIDREVLTIGVGPHPLFNGVKRVLITGLPERPVLDDSVGVVALHIGEVKVKFTGATLKRSGRQMEIHLAAPTH